MVTNTDAHYMTVSLWANNAASNAASVSVDFSKFTIEFGASGWNTA